VSGGDRVLALSGGVGGAKLALGLSRIVPGEKLSIVANTGDDFQHLGLTICPDIDTLIYTLSGLSDQERGWGRTDETWTFMAALQALGGEAWFNLGDGDLALHVHRRTLLDQGLSLSEATARIAGQLGISARILPMSDDAVPTLVDTDQGRLAFQHYFVREQCAPAVTGFVFEGIEDAVPNPDFLASLGDPGLAAIVLTPSNPFVSIDPILALPGVRAALKAARAPIVAVSPIVGGQAIKGPAAKMFGELGVPASAQAVAAHYEDLIDGFVIDHADTDTAAQIEGAGPQVLVTQTVMKDLADRENLGREVLGLAASIGQRKG
jgi:LPPG:FO 2-phospho-L-lactate transferase